MALVPFPSATPGDDEDPESFDDSGSKMSFLEHLDELRKRLIYVVYALIAGCVIAYIFIGKIFDFIMRPMQQVLAAGRAPAVHGRPRRLHALREDRASWSASSSRRR